MAGLNANADRAVSLGDGVTLGGFVVRRRPKLCALRARGKFAKLIT